MMLKCESCIESWIFPTFFDWLLFIPRPRPLNIVTILGMCRIDKEMCREIKLFLVWISWLNWRISGYDNCKHSLISSRSTCTNFKTMAQSIMGKGDSTLKQRPFLLNCVCRLELLSGEQCGPWASCFVQNLWAFANQALNKASLGKNIQLYSESRAALYLIGEMIVEKKYTEDCLIINLVAYHLKEPLGQFQPNMAQNRIKTYSNLFFLKGDIMFTSWNFSGHLTFFL